MTTMGVAAATTSRSASPLGAHECYILLRDRPVGGKSVTGTALRRTTFDRRIKQCSELTYRFLATHDRRHR